MRLFKFSLLFALFLPAAIAMAQDQAVGAMVGQVSGFVEDDEGNMVEPKAAIDASVDISSDGGDITAVINGVASCTEGLGLQITFHATYDHASNSLIGTYSDIPNATVLDKEILFTNTGGLNWTAAVSGQAPSPNGLRAYDLQLAITLPKKAIFPGDQYPDTKSYSGDLNTTASVTVPLSIPLLGIDEMLTVDVNLTGRWSAKTVPTDNGTPDINGNVMGSITGLEPVSLEVAIPGSDPESLQFDVVGTFGGSLFVTGPTELTFAGSWAASTGDDGFGGDMSITIPLDDIAHLDSVPYSFSGNFSFDPDIAGAPSLIIPFQVTGLFPFSLE